MSLREIRVFVENLTTASSTGDEVAQLSCYGISKDCSLLFKKLMVRTAQSKRR